MQAIWMRIRLVLRWLQWRIDGPIYRWPFIGLAAAYLLILLLDIPQITSLARALTALQVATACFVAIASGAGVLFLADGFLRRRGRKRPALFDVVLFYLPYVLLQVHLLLYGQNGLWGLGAGAIGLSVLALYWTRPDPTLPLSPLIIFVVLAYGAIAAATVFAPVAFPQQVGTLALILATLGFAAISVGVILSKQLIGVIALIAVSILFIAHDLPHRAQPIAGLKSIAWGASIDVAFQAWLSQRKDLEHYRSQKRPYPVLLTAAAGGGGFAAAHAYSLLMTMQARCANFGQHTFALVGVSGGALGSALFQSKLRDNPEAANPSQFSDCIPASEISLDFFERDHLAPLAAGLFFRDLPSRLWPFGDERTVRTQLFLSSWSSVEPSFSLFTKPYLSHFWPEDVSEGEDPAFNYPALLPIATEVAGGQRFVISPFQFESDAPQSSKFLMSLNTGEDGEIAPLDFKLGDMVLASASFPYVTPSLVIAADPAESYTLVDGGYYENSGGETVQDIYQNLARAYSSGDGEEGPCNPTYVKDPLQETTWDECGIPFSLTALAIVSYSYGSEADQNPQPGAIDKSDPAIEHPDLDSSLKPAPTVQSLTLAQGNQNFFFDPLSALFNANSGRGSLALKRLESQFCEGEFCAHPEHPNLRDGLLRHHIDPDAYNLPLGWTMPGAGLNLIKSSVSPAPEICLKFQEYASIYGNTDEAENSENEFYEEPNSWPLYQNCFVTAELVRLLSAPAEPPNDCADWPYTELDPEVYCEP